MDPPPPPDPAAPLQTTEDAVRRSDKSAASAQSPSQPSYAEMITSALIGLNESDGSSKQAIGKYIEAHYAGLPPNHAALLSDHLKMLKSSGELVMVKHSYKLAARSAAASTNGDANNAVNSSDSATKRRRGRPPKPKVDINAEVQPAVPVFASSPQNVGPAGPDNASAAAAGGGPEPAGTANGVKRGRGRPPKTEVTANSRPGRPPKGGGAGRGRPRGRPPKLANIAGAAPGTESVGPVVRMKRRGRPPKNAAAGGDVGNGNSQAPKKPRRLSGKPLGRPRKNAVAIVSNGTQTTLDSQLLVAYLDLKSKFESLQARIRQTAALVRPCLNNEDALRALQELEIGGRMNPLSPPPAQPPQIVPHQI